MSNQQPATTRHVVQTAVDPEDETIQGILSMLDIQERSISQAQADLPRIISEALTEALAPVTARLLTEEEREYVKVATKIAVQRLKFREALIEKTLTALLWAFVVGLASVTWTLVTEFAKNHGWKS